MFDLSNRMHFHNLPEHLLGSRTRLAVLRALLRTPGAEFTGRELARAANVSPSQALAALRVFEMEGFCHQRRHGRSSVWAADPDHFITRGLNDVLHLDQTAMARLEEVLHEALDGSGAEEAYLFGSVATGAEDANSDIDLLVVFPSRRAALGWQGKLEALRPRVEKEFSNFLSPLVYAREQVRKGAPLKLLEEARRTGAVIEVGK
jgi:predicted nucleotidyltransferase